MTAYRAEFVFTDIDGNMFTNGEASVTMNINADDYATAFLLANHLLKIFGADHHVLDQEPTL